MFAPFIFFILVTQDKVGFPFTSNKQAPQAACPLQPSLTDTIPSTSRKYVNRDNF
jgi:hypothetical protein